MFKRVLSGFSDFYFDYEEVDGDDDLNSEYPCPFCPEEYDLVELCCHIDDEHPVEAQYGVSKIANLLLLSLRLLDESVLVSIVLLMLT